MTQWRAAPDAGAFSPSRPLEFNLKFFRRLDRRFAELNDAGLVAVPVLLWANSPPGSSLPDEDAIRLARYMVTRYGAIG